MLPEVAARVEPAPACTSPGLRGMLAVRSCMRLGIYGWFALALVGCAAPAPQPDPVQPVSPAPVEPPATPVPEPVVAEPVVPEHVEPVAPVEPVTPGPAQPVAAAEPSRDLEVVARLVEPRSAPHCGYFKFFVVMRYEVVRVVAGTYDATDLYVAHSCPELAPTRCRDVGEQVREYVAGDVHHLRLRRGKGDGTLVDKFTDKTLQRYRSQCTSLVPAP